MRLTRFVYVLFRPVMGLFAAGYVVASFRAQHLAVDRNIWVYATAVFFVASATMCWNDFLDREHDRVKHKTFCHDHPWFTGLISLILWTVSMVALSWVTFRISKAAGMILAAQIVIGLSYSLSYRVPLLSSILVAAVSATAGLFVMFAPFTINRPLGVLLVVIVFLAIFAREIVKDIEDVTFDKEIKTTLPVLLGNTTLSKRIAVGVLALAASLCTATIGMPLIALLGYITWVGSGLSLYYEDDLRFSKAMLDAGMVFILIALIVK